jgi:hypothetical protein
MSHTCRAACHSCRYRWPASRSRTRGRYHDPGRFGSLRHPRPSCPPVVGTMPLGLLGARQPAALYHASKAWRGVAVRPCLRVVGGFRRAAIIRARPQRGHW